MSLICLLPIGRIESRVLKAISSSLKEVFSCRVKQLQGLPLPKDAYNPGRKQYYSTLILKRLIRSSPCDRVLAITDVDLYVPGLNFVFGEADVSRGVAIISLTRLRQEFYGLPPDSKLFLLRAAKEAVHEIGHTYGLGHCPDPRCVMHFSNSLHDTDVKSYRPCRRCLQRIK
jgi:archaemetzincin